jgi:hypothetical protein
MRQRSIIAAAAATALLAGSTAAGTVARAATGAPVPAALLVGAHSVDGFTSAEQAIGPLSAARFYYTTLPGSFVNSPEARLPSGVVPVISYNTPDQNVVAYAKSVNRPIWLDFHHEPEDHNAYSSGAAYVAQFEAQSKLIRSAGNPDVKVVTINAGYAYRTSHGNGLDGSYLPPASYVDAYMLDLYQICCTGERWPAQGLADYDRFQNWLKLVGNRGKPLGFGEYGIEASDAVRDARITADASYLRSAFSGTFGLWDYFWVGIWRFTDAATIATWRSIAASS